MYLISSLLRPGSQKTKVFGHICFSSEPRRSPSSSLHQPKQTNKQLFCSAVAARCETEELLSAADHHNRFQMVVKELHLGLGENEGRSERGGVCDFPSVLREWENVVWVFRERLSILRSDLIPGSSETFRTVISPDLTCSFLFLFVSVLSYAWNKIKYQSNKLGHGGEESGNLEVKVGDEDKFKHSRGSIRSCIILSGFISQ